jgi:phosphate transport system permease protein
MSTLTPPLVDPTRGMAAGRARLNTTDRRANSALRWLALGGGSLIFVVMFAIAYQVIDGAITAYDKFGVSFLGHKVWIPAAGQFGAKSFIFGTLVTGLTSITLATLLGVSIGLFLSMLAPRRVSAIIGPLVEMLAAIPSVVLGLIGIYLICPFLKSDVEPALHSVLGFLPIFGDPQPVGNSLFAASLVLTIMVLPIVAALSRDLFLTVPIELRDGAEALGATRWEMIRGVVLPTTSSGVIAACVLGFGRAIGEAIAVAAVVGDQPLNPTNLFQGGDTLASRIALQFASPVSALHTSSLFYLAGILFVFGLLTNLAARWIARGMRT